MNHYTKKPAKVLARTYDGTRECAEELSVIFGCRMTVDHVTKELHVFPGIYPLHVVAQRGQTLTKNIKTGEFQAWNPEEFNKVWETLP